MLRWWTLVAIVSAGLAVGSCGSNSSISTTSLAEPASVDSTIPQSLDEIDSEILDVTIDGEAVEQPAPYFGAQDATASSAVEHACNGNRALQPARSICLFDPRFPPQGIPDRIFTDGFEA